MKTTTIEKKHLIIEADDIKTRFPDHNFEYEQYRDYRDAIDEKVNTRKIDDWLTINNL